ncbi:MAG TPA: dUTP diphosphatase [Bacilli bacterium]|nr:dUTP diphosphatase [Bacilli bacterium]
MEFDFEFLLEKQAELDALIHLNHKVSYESTKTKRLLAFLVELGELANAKRSFKFWSLKAGESNERLLDEYADGLHFLLSLALAHEFELPVFTIEEDAEQDLTEKFLACYQSITTFSSKLDKSSLYLAFSDFLALGQALSFTKEEIIAAYENKLVVNYQRQINKY